MFVAIGVLLIGLTSYLAALAYALRGYSRARLAERLGEGGRGRLEWLTRHEGELQALTGFIRMVGNLSILVWVFIGFQSAASGPLTLQAALAPAGVTLLVLLVFSIGIPHAIALHATETVIAANLLILRGLRIPLWPLAKMLVGIEFVVRRLMGKAAPDSGDETLQTELEILDAVQEGTAVGAVAAEQQEMISNVLELRETTASAIMTPRTEITAIKADATRAEVFDLVLHAQHSRIPVYEKSIDHIIGVLYVKDLITPRAEEKFELRRLIRPVPYVPGGKPIDALLREFRHGKVHIAIVLDEYGGTAGLVTIEDILEELVGEIDDEYDETAAPAIRRLDDDTLEADARVHVSEINDELGVALPDNADYETIGGFVFATLGRIPVKGEEFTHQNVQFQVIEAEPRKINRLRLHVLREAAAT